MFRIVGSPRRLGPAYVVLVLQLSACASAQRPSREPLASRWQPPTARLAEPRPAAAVDFETAELTTLERRTFVQQVLQRSPSLESARQAWRAALAVAPQASALEDPMLEYSFAPLSIGSGRVPYGQSITLSQRLPWPGTRSLRGDVEEAEAEAARENLEATKRSLAVMATSLFDEYYAVTRSLELNLQHHALVSDIKQAAEGQYAAGRGSQQQALQAEVELAHVEHDRVMLSARKNIVAAQMNGLLRRDPELPLPPPPESLQPNLSPVGDSRSLRELALRNRPELRAAAARLKGRESAIEVAKRRSYPELGVMTSYSSMWAMPEHQWMVGASANLPIQLGARQAAEAQARAERAQVAAGLQSLHDEVGVAVERARQAVLQAQHVVHVYAGRLLPAARAQIEVAQIGYATGQNSFGALIDAERSIRVLELTHQEALAELGRKWGELEQALGQIAGLAESENKP